MNQAALARIVGQDTGLDQAPKPQVVVQNSPRDQARGQLRVLDDASLVGLTLENNEVAFEILMQRYSAMVLGFVYEKTHSESDAEELSQEIFLTAYRGLRKLKARSQFRQWLMQIARTRVIDFYRFRGRRPTIVSVVSKDADLSETDYLENVRDSAPTPSERLADSETSLIILGEIEALKEKYRIILQMRLINQDSTSEIAERLNMKESSVRMRLHRGLKLLRDRLSKRGIAPGRAEEVE